MAITVCTVSGTVFTPAGQGMAGVTVKAYIPHPFTHTDGTLVVGYETSTTTDTNGAWSLNLVETTTVMLTMTIAFEYSSGSAGDYLRREYTVTIPNQSSVNFSTLIGTQL